MTHRFRYWKSYPPTPTPMERRHSSRIVAVCLSVAILLCVISIAILFAFVLDLKASRDREVSDRTTAIDQALCQVLDEFHHTSPDLLRVRAQLHCTIPTP